MSAASSKRSRTGADVMESTRSGFAGSAPRWIGRGPKGRRCVRQSGAAGGRIDSHRPELPYAYPYAYGDGERSRYECVYEYGWSSGSTTWIDFVDGGKHSPPAVTH